MGPWRFLVESYLVDWFSLAHVVFFAACAWALRFRRVGRTLLAILILGLLWECVEMSLVEPWLGFHEPPLNRWLSDPLFDLLGGWLGWGLRERLRPPS